MGTKGAKMTSASSESAEKLEVDLSSLGDISSRKMFGGHGVFLEGKMFALVDSDGGVFFKADDSNIGQFEEASAAKHGRMPYYQVPDGVLDDEDVLLAWAESSILVSKSAK